MNPVTLQMSAGFLLQGDSHFYFRHKYLKLLTSAIQNPLTFL